MLNSSKTYGKSTEGKNNLCTNREIMHLCQVNEIIEYILIVKFMHIFLPLGVSLSLVMVMMLNRVPSL